MGGALVVLEGAEGVGKSTQLRRLAARVSATGLTVTTVREPGGTAIGDEVRRLLLDSPHVITPRAEALLFMASRAQLIEQVILPALSAGHVVLTDRFFLSTYAYQVAGRGLEQAGVTAANNFATAGLTPDITILLDLPPDEGASRMAARGGADRVELAGDDFHARVRQAFQAYASEVWQDTHPECGPIALVNALGTESDVEARIWAELCTRLPETFRVSLGSHSST